MQSCPGAAWFTEVLFPVPPYRVRVSERALGPGFAAAIKVNWLLPMIDCAGRPVIQAAECCGNHAQSLELAVTKREPVPPWGGRDKLLGDI